MPYPDNIDRFTDKLNKKQTGVYVIEEELTVTGGKYDGMLIHDNIIASTIRVYTGPKLTGTPVTNYVVSVSDEVPWKRYIKIFTDAPKVYVTYETTGDTVEADDVNALQYSVMVTQTEVERYKTVNDSLVTDARTRLSAVEAAKADKTYVDTQLLTKADKSNTYTKAETDQRVQTIVGAAPGALDTLRELADALDNDPNFAASMTTQLATKVDKVAGKGLSTEDFSSAEKSKLAGIAAGATNYTHPVNHPPSIILQDSSNRFVSDADKALWNGKASTALVTGSTNGLMSSADKAKLDGVAANANNYVHPSTPGSKHIPGGGAAGNVLVYDSDGTGKWSGEYVTRTEMGNAGYGDMLKSIYDTDNDGKVDAAETSDNSLMLDGKDASFFVQKNASDTIVEVLHQADGWHNNIAGFAYDGVPTNGIKIRTNIPSTTAIMPVIKIEGYIYGVPASVGLLICFYWFAGFAFFANPTVTSYGSLMPTVTLGIENGKVVIYLDIKSSQPRLSISALNLGFTVVPNTTYEGWVIIDEAISDTATNIVTVPYQSNYMPKGPVTWGQLKGV